MIIKLVRHGQSHGNAFGHNNAENADHAIPLTAKGIQQATEAGYIIGQQFVERALIYTSPYLRARQTCDALTSAALENRMVTPERVFRYEDPRLREMEHGYGDVKEQDHEALQSVHGAFFYRFRGGESPADCYDRICTFLESMMRQTARKEIDDVLIVSHGITIRCFVMRFMHRSVEDFNSLRNPWNGDIITIGPREQIANPQWVSGKWAVEGLKFKEKDEGQSLRTYSGLRTATQIG